MLYSCWSAKGGAGATVVAAALGLALAHREGAALLVDAAGDLPAALGIADHDGPGLAEWLAAGTDVPVDAFARLELDAGAGLSLVPRGRAAMPETTERAEVLAELLAADARPVIVDCGVVGSAGGGEVARVLAASATRSLLVIRPCYLALRRAGALALRPSGVVVVTEPGRALDAADVGAVLDVPVVATVPFDTSISRAVDAGLLGARVPRALARALRHAA